MLAPYPRPSEASLSFLSEPGCGPVFGLDPGAAIGRHVCGVGALRHDAPPNHAHRQPRTRLRRPRKSRRAAPAGSRRRVPRGSPAGRSRGARGRQPLTASTSNTNSVSAIPPRPCSIRTQPVEVGASVVGDRDQLTVQLQARRKARAELGQQLSHVPAAPAALSEGGVVQTMQRNPSSFGSNVQRSPRGIAPVRASIGSGSRRATSRPYLAADATQRINGAAPGR